MLFLSSVSFDVVVFQSPDVTAFHGVIDMFSAFIAANFL